MFTMSVLVSFFGIDLDGKYVSFSCVLPSLAFHGFLLMCRVSMQCLLVHQR